MWGKKYKWSKKPKITKHEIAKAKKPEHIQRLIESYPHSWHLDETHEVYYWFKIIKDLTESTAKNIDLSRNNLDNIIKDLDRTSYHMHNSPDRYKISEVQQLIDYSISLRYAMNWLMKESIERGIAEYDSSGRFHIKDEENEILDDSIGETEK